MTPGFPLGPQPCKPLLGCKPKARVATTCTSLSKSTSTTPSACTFNMLGAFSSRLVGVEVLNVHSCNYFRNAKENKKTQM